MRKIFFFLGICALAAFNFSSALWAGTNFAAKKNDRQIRISPPEKNLRIGEKLLFDAYWVGIHVGTGSLEVKEIATVSGREAYHIIAVAETNDFLSKLYPVRDVVETFVDTQDLYSLEFRKTVKEGFYRADEKIIYDYASKIGRYESLRNKSKKEFPLPEKVHDFLSVFYWARLEPWQVGKSIRTTVNDDEKNWDLELQVLRTEAKEMKGGKVMDTVVIEPKTSMKGILYNRGRAWVHFSTDSQRKPILIFIQTPFGPITGVLKEDK